MQKATGRVSPSPILDHIDLENLVYDERIEKHASEWPFPWLESMMTTGFMFFSNAWMDYVKNHKHPSYRDSVFLLADNHGSYAKHALGGHVETPLFIHGRAGAWHSWDARIVLSIEQKPVLAVVGLVLVMVAWLLAMLIGCCGRPRLCKGRKHRETDSKRRDVRRDVVEARKRRADNLHEMQRRRREVLPSHHTTPPEHDSVSRLLAALAPAQGASLFNGGYLTDNNDTVSPIALPPRATSYPGSHAGRTSSIMIPPRNTGYGGRPSSIYDFAY
jgi:hypothetical protein